MKQSILAWNQTSVSAVYREGEVGLFWRTGHCMRWQPFPTTVNPFSFVLRKEAVSHSLTKYVTWVVVPSLPHRLACHSPYSTVLPTLSSSQDAPNEASCQQNNSLRWASQWWDLKEKRGEYRSSLPEVTESFARVLSPCKLWAGPGAQAAVELFAV